MNATTVIAVAGLITTLAAGALTTWLQHWASRRQDLQSRRIEIYLELQRYLKHLAHRVEVWQMDERDPSYREWTGRIVASDDLDSGVALLCPPEIRDSWERLANHEFWVLFELGEDPQYHHDGSAVPDDYPHLQELKDEVKRLGELLVKAAQR